MLKKLLLICGRPYLNMNFVAMVRKNDKMTRNSYLVCCKVQWNQFTYSCWFKEASDLDLAEMEIVIFIASW